MELGALGEDLLEAPDNFVLVGGEHGKGDEVAHVQEADILLGVLIKHRGGQDVIIKEDGEGSQQRGPAVNLNDLSMAQMYLGDLHKKIIIKQYRKNPEIQNKIYN